MDLLVEAKRKIPQRLQKKIRQARNCFSITDKVTISESTVGNLEYKRYITSSIVEEYITSIKLSARIPALLYFYANISLEDISKILKDSESNMAEIINKSPTKIYEIIKNKVVD